ncbi:MAG TPA: 50S ribosomal protein L29 [Firmicutes bacterium]|nr:50S ribosomal protein L29 [Bacillota bacterium]
MKIEEIRNLSRDELLNKVESLKEELMRLRFNKKSGQLTDTSKIKKTRREISRILTVLKQKETKKQE